MSDTPKFTVVDRRKFRGDEEASEPVNSEETTPVAAVPEPATKPAASNGPRLTLVEPLPQQTPIAVADEAIEEIDNTDNVEDVDADLPPVPTAEESRFQKVAYDQAAERLNDLVRAQNPGAPAPENIGFEHLVQQLYLSAMMQMGAGTPEGQRPRIDILGARQTIDLLDVVLDKTAGNLSAQEQRTLDTVLFELRMTFLELTRMISAQPPMPPPPGGAKR
ncbi:DUF1844 domain-containing protein [Acidicapsa ligni]|uniref:DUF1844 domain-containing protein n=1 Tax=Acidicapsa ligni TaxID=542300 RepID=UPI0021E0013A|nr:DUF1844 domain-containing protein [Acidicapsa ligni]